MGTHSCNEDTKLPVYQGPNTVSSVDGEVAGLKPHHMYKYMYKEKDTPSEMSMRTNSQDEFSLSGNTERQGGEFENEKSPRV